MAEADRTLRMAKTLAAGGFPEEAPPLQPETTNASLADDKQRPRNKPIMSAGTGP